MASETDICNAALDEIGAKAITSLTQGTKNANACNRNYATLRDALLRNHNWNFAMTRVKLAQITATPITEFDKAYTVPPDNLRVVEVHDNDAGQGRLVYRLEGEEGSHTLLADAPDVWLRYVRRKTDPNDMPPDFREALTYRLAWRLAGVIANSNTLKREARDDYRSALRTAKSNDALEDFPQDAPESDWVSARHGGTTPTNFTPP